MTFPSLSDVEVAQKRIENYVFHTPIIESPDVNSQLGFRLLLKMESFQRTGSFKFRGAFNKISKLVETQICHGVVAFSSGNHAQGVAAAAKIFDIPAIIVMPSDAPETKITRTRNYGAEVILYDRKDGNRVAIAQQIKKDTGYELIPPYDDLDILAGQGTVALETLKYLETIDCKIDTFLTPISGGGLMSGCALALKGIDPSINLVCVEPNDYNDTELSLAHKKRIKLVPNRPSICDALLLETPGKLTFEIIKTLGVRGISVTDYSTQNAMKIAFNEFKVVLEPSGAIALAAALDKNFDYKPKCILAVCSGGNVDQNFFKETISKI